MYRDCLCRVGAGQADKQSLTGHGCLLSPDLAITAWHVFGDLCDDQGFAWPVIAKHDGLFRCDVVLAEKKADLAVLRAIEQIHDVDIGEAAKVYPTIGPDPTRQGMAVGYMSTFEKTDAETKTKRTYNLFSSAHNSLMVASPALSWVLSGGFGEAGFSGCPVFLPNANLIGVMGKGWTTGIRNELASHFQEEDVSMIYSAPVYMPITQYKEQLDKVISESGENAEQE